MHSTCLAQAQLYVTPKLAMSIRRVIPLSTPSSHFTSGPLSWRKHILSPNTRHETHGDIQSSIPTTATCLSSKCNEHNPSHVRRHTLPSQPSQHLITQFRLNTHNLSRVLQHQKQTQYSMLQNKNLFIKIHFDSRHLTSSFYLYLPLNLARGLTTLSEETTQRKHTYVTTIFLANNKLPSR